MKIGILTFSAAVNYGAVLQAYALKEVVASMGHDVHVIDYKPKYITEFYAPFAQRPGLRSLVGVEGWKLWFNFIRGGRRRYIRRRKFQMFNDKHLSLAPFSSLNSTDTYDILILGSDQIWNPHITGEKYDKVLFGCFPHQNFKTVAYAASVGSIDMVSDTLFEFLPLLSNINSLSAREQNLADYIHAHTNREIITVPDPTLLAARQSFEAITSAPLVKKKYLLYFDLFNDSVVRAQSKKIAEQLKLQFVELSTYHEFVPGQKVFRPAAPKEFCSLVKHADFVATTSFHGTVFSLIFHRPFATFEHESSKNDRILNLLHQIGLQHKFVFRDAPTYDTSYIEWNEIDAQISKIRTVGLDYLNKNLTETNA